MNIEKLAEEKYPTTGFFARSEIRKGEQKAFIAGYQSCETRSKKIVEALSKIIGSMSLERIERFDLLEQAKQALTDYEGEEGIK